MSTDIPLTIAIEAAIAGGSLFLSNGQVEIDTRLAEPGPTRAEDLLPGIDLLLKENGHQITEVGLVAVSAGPGSFTGVRIGFSTALGLSAGLGVDFSSESALKAMANDHRGHSKLAVAIPMGRETVCLQLFDTLDGVLERSGPISKQEEPFLDSVLNDPETVFVLHHDLFTRINGPHPLIIDFGKNVAGAIGRICMPRPRPQIQPIFISKNMR